MKLIYNNYFPFGSFYAANIFGLIFCRSDKGRLDEVEKSPSSSSLRLVAFTQEEDIIITIRKQGKNDE